ncbi:uncharacterized protein LOC142241531 [Haematobia irritans]|uniref:uncharacterized protein LOC142241531 n=1 Tax=Haematobia irritans TaxID=7368 RepID=UPI003F503831
MYLSTKSQQLLQCCILVISIVQSGMAIPHQFFFDNEDLFSPCEDVPPGAGDIHDLFDLTNFTMAYDDGNMYISGNITCVWKDLAPDDRIEGQVQIYKFGRGKWQPTVMSAVVPDVCVDIFQKGSLTNQVWGQSIFEEDRKCITNYGHVYHHRPFHVDMVYNLNLNVAGRYKIVIIYVAITKDGIKRPNYICLSILGEVVKI